MHLPEILTVLLVLSFGLESLASGLLAVLRLIPLTRPFCEANSKDEVAAYRYRAAHTGLATSIALGFCYIVGLGVFQPILNKTAIAANSYFSLLDPAITAMVLAAGSERLSAFRKKLDDSSTTAGEDTATDPDTKEGDVTARATYGDALSKTLELSVSRDVEGVAEGQKTVGTWEEEE